MNVLAPFPELAEFAMRVTSKQSGVGFVERCHKVAKRIIATGARKDQKFERSASQAFVNVNSKQMKKIADPLYEVPFPGIDAQDDETELCAAMLVAGLEDVGD